MINSDEAYKVINIIADLSGNSKQIFLRTQDIKEYLLAAYDPYTKYHITGGKLGKGDMHFVDLTWEILHKLSTRELSGYSAQSVVNSITAGMTPESSTLFHRILNKDLRMGMGAKTINKVFPGLIPTHDVMLAKLFDPEHLKFPCFGSPKIDGVRAKFKNGVFYSRNGHPYLGLENLSDLLHGVTEDLDGELIVPGVSFQLSSGLIRSNDPTPMAEFHIFDVPTVIAPFIERLIIIDDIDMVFNSLFIKKVNHISLYEENGVMDFYQTCRNLGYEGAVIKPHDYVYKGTRSYDWMKMKQILSEDLVVKSLFEGKGKYKNQMGGAIVEFKGNPNKVGGGWSDMQRKEYWYEPENIIGKTIEVAYMEETDDGNMRHSRFIGFRPDKEE